MCCHHQNPSEYDHSNMKDSSTMAQNYHKNTSLLQALRAVPLRNVTEQVWDILRTSGVQITISIICEDINISYYKAKSLLDSWIKSGHAKRKKSTNPKTSRPQYVYEIVRDCGQQPPRVNLQGIEIQSPYNEMCWRSIRILKTFNANQLVPDSLVKLNTVKQYLRQLHMAGYLMMIESKVGQLAVYRIMHDTGPKAPEIRRGKKVYDGNLGLIIYDPKTTLQPSHQLKSK